MAKVTIIRAVKPMAKISTPQTGDSSIYSGDVYLNWGENNGLVSYFNIPVIEAPSLKPVKVATHTYKRRVDGDDISGTTYKDVTVPEHESSMAASKLKRAGKIIIIPTEVDGPNTIPNTTNKRKLKAYIGLPSWFTVQMIDQVIGQLIVAHVPNYYIYNNRKRPFNVNTTKALISGAKSGAWVTNVVAAAANEKEVAPGEITQVAQKGRSTKKAK